MRSVGAIIEDLETRDLLELAKRVARKHRVTLEELLGRGRGNPEAAARHELWYRLYDEIPSFPRIGQIFGRDHSTVLAAVHKYEKRHGDPAAAIVDTGDPVGSTCDPQQPAQAVPEGPQLKKCTGETPPGETAKSVAS